MPPPRVVSAVLARSDLAAVRQPELHDIGPDLRGIASPSSLHLLPGQMAHVLLGGAGGQLRRLHRVLADGIGILIGDPMIAACAQQSASAPATRTAWKTGAPTKTMGSSGFASFHFGP
jgi:hypothetical protein